MMSLEIEIMMMQLHVQRVKVEDLMEAAIQRCSLKKVFFKESRILKMTSIYINFLKMLLAKSLQLSQK